MAAAIKVEEAIRRRGWSCPLTTGACVAAFVAVATWAAATPVAAQSIADLFRGKTVRLLLPTAPGGGRALYALPFAEAYGRHIPGNPTVVPVFMPGAGGSTAVNNAYGVAAEVRGHRAGAR
jgi:tripartite-type tricarboxylate transporter receptor subunit TctC